MKIYNTNIFEKLNINQINLQELSNIKKFYEFEFERIKDLHDINFDDILDGWIIVTIDHDVWTLFDVEHCRKFFEGRYEKYDCKSLIRPHSSTISGLSFMPINVYNGTFPNIYGDCTNDLDICAVYKTNININEFETPQQFVDFYDKYNIIDSILKDLNENI